MTAVLAPAKLMSWSRVTLTTASPEMAALRAGVRRGAGMRRVPPWLAVLLVTGYRVSIVSLNIKN